MIIKIHKVDDIKEKLGTWRAFADAVGIREQNVRRYKSGYVVIEHKGRFTLGSEEFWK